MGVPADDTTAGTLADRDRFTAAWRLALPSLRAFCRRTMQHPQDADDLLQHVALRAWRGIRTFRGTSSFQTWVLRIAEHEASRLGARRLRQRRAELPLDVAALGPAAHAPAEDPVEAWSERPDGSAVDEMTRTAIAGAHRAGLLNDTEHTVLTRRLDHPDLTWEQLAAPLGLTAVAAAVAHSRGIPKLRVYLFQSAPTLLGGTDEIQAAFELARTARTDRLSPDEALTFQRIVLDGAVTYRPRGWQLRLRSACAKVSRQLPGAPASHPDHPPVTRDACQPPGPPTSHPGRPPATRTTHQPPRTSRPGKFAAIGNDGGPGGSGPVTQRGGEPSGLGIDRGPG